MITRLNDGVRNAVRDALLTLFDGGTAEFRTGAQPALANSAATGTVVCTVALPSPAFQTGAAGVMSKAAGIWQDLSADNGGTIGYARFKSADGTKVMDFDVTDTAGSGAIKIDNPVLVAGQQFIVASFALTVPATS